MLYSKLTKLTDDLDSQSTCKFRKSDCGSHCKHVWQCLLRVQYIRALRIARKRVEHAEAAKEAARRHVQDPAQDPMEGLVAGTNLDEAQRELAELESTAPSCPAHITAVEVGHSNGEALVRIRALDLRHTCVQLGTPKAGMPRAVDWQDFAAWQAQLYIDMHCSASAATLKGMIAQYVRNRHLRQCTSLDVTNSHVDYGRKALRLYVNGPERCFGFLPYLGKMVMDADPHAVFEISVVTVPHTTLNFIVAEDGQSISPHKGPCRSREVDPKSQATVHKQHRILAKVKKEVDANWGSPCVRSGDPLGVLLRHEARLAWQLHHAKRICAIQREQARLLPTAQQLAFPAVAVAGRAAYSAAVRAKAVPAVPAPPVSCAAVECNTAPSVGIPLQPGAATGFVKWSSRARQGDAHASDAMKRAGGQGQPHTLQFCRADNAVSPAGDGHAAVRQATAVPAVPAAQGSCAAVKCNTAPSVGIPLRPGAGTPVPAFPAAPAAEAMDAAGTKGLHERCNFPSADNPIEVLHCEDVFYLVGKGLRALLSKCTQPHLLVDYCHCKCGGGLYVVVTQDGNNHILPIAVQWRPNFEVGAFWAGKAELGAVTHICSVRCHLTPLHVSVSLSGLVICLPSPGQRRVGQVRKAATFGHRQANRAARHFQRPHGRHGRRG